MGLSKITLPIFYIHWDYGDGVDVLQGHYTYYGDTIHNYTTGIAYLHSRRQAAIKAPSASSSAKKPGSKGVSWTPVTA